MPWPPPSPRVRELIRQGAQITIDPRAEWLAELNRATTASNPAIAADPALSAAIHRANLANLLHWSAANVRDPGAPVDPNLGDEPLSIARDLVRRGLDAATLDAYRVGQIVAWQRWMEIAFGLTSDPVELHEMLDVSSRSISEFIDGTLAAIAARIDLERDELTRGTHAERREAVALLLEGAPILRARAEARLGYALTGPHTALIVWIDRPDRALAQLDRAVDAIGRASPARPLRILAATGTQWLWVPGSAGVDVTRVRQDLDDLPDVLVAIGPTADGVEGFRRSHLDALTTQRMLARLRSTQRVALFTDVHLVALVTQDPERADEFIGRVLGDFESAPTDLHATVLAFVQEQCNVSRTAERLYAHRNTVLRRLARADELLPRPLHEATIQVAVALQALQWRGDRG